MRSTGLSRLLMLYVHTSGSDKQTVSGGKKGINSAELTATPFVKTCTRPPDRCQNLMLASVSVKAWVCGRSLAEIEGSNPADRIDFFLL